jgi:SAM-dependent methyltransferase
MERFTAFFATTSETMRHRIPNGFVLLRCSGRVALVINAKSILTSLYRRKQAHSALKALIPLRYHERIRQWFRSDSGVQWCRVVMNDEIKRFIQSLDCSRIDALEISGIGSQGQHNFRSYRTVQYPEYDICKEPLAQGQFDLIIAEQVLEHVLRPDRAVANVYQMLRSGGHFVVSTPFLVKVHEYPLDLYRWTEQGMRQLLEAAGFAIIVTGSWGNRECLSADMNPGLEWTPYNPRRHSLHNEQQFAIVVWAFAEKRESVKTSAD